MIWRYPAPPRGPYEPPVRIWSDTEGAAAVASGEFVEVRDRITGALVGWKPREAGWSPYPAPPAGTAVPEGAP